jgi:hypothetical protein
MTVTNARPLDLPRAKKSKKITVAKRLYVSYGFLEHLLVFVDGSSMHGSFSAMTNQYTLTHALDHARKPVVLHDECDSPSAGS